MINDTAGVLIIMGAAVARTAKQKKSELKIEIQRKDDSAKETGRLTDEDLDKVAGGAIDAFMDFTKQTSTPPVATESKP